MRSSVPFPPYKSCKDFMSMLLPETTLLGCTTTRDNWDRINEQVGARGGDDYDKASGLACVAARHCAVQAQRRARLIHHCPPANPCNTQFTGGLVDQLRSQLSRIINSGDWWVA